MAWWKKFLILLSVGLGIALIFFLILYCLFINFEVPTMATGQYELVKVTKTIDNNEEDFESYSGGEYYIIVGKELTIESHSSTIGIAENETGYGYIVYSNELVIFLQTDEAEIVYIGYYYEDSGQIKICITIEDVTYNYYYQYMETAE